MKQTNVILKIITTKNDLLVKRSISSLKNNLFILAKKAPPFPYLLLDSYLMLLVALCFLDAPRISIRGCFRPSVGPLVRLTVTLYFSAFLSIYSDL